MPGEGLSVQRGLDGYWRLRSEIWLPRPQAEVFAFFADAANLDVLTPPWVNFRILTPLPITMAVGTLIDYEIGLHGVPVRWQTEITCWNPPHGFVDDQRRGPYREWHHTHTFESVDGGVRCRDDVRYRVPGGALVNRFLVEPDVRRIFTYRAARLRDLFRA